MSLPAEIKKKIKLLELNTRKLVNSLFAGHYHSAFKGQGMTFSDFREYVPGDDVRTISWNLTARTGKTYIKKYEEERELNLILAVDVSGSMGFGSKSILKGEAITHIAALLSFAATKNNDNVGLLLFSDQVEHFVPPKKGRGHVQRILRDLYYHEPKKQTTKISVAVDYLSGILKKRSTVFLMSDFLSEDSFGYSLKRLARKHEVISVIISDEAEINLPSVGLIDFYDPETEETYTVDSSSAPFRKRYLEEVKKKFAVRDTELKKSQIDLIKVPNTDDFLDPVLSYFRARSH